MGRWLPRIFIVTLALPTALSTHVGDLLITPYRVLCIVASFLVAPRLFGGQFRWCPADGFVILYAFWGTICFFNAGGVGGAQSAGSLVLESVVPYFMARIWVTTTPAIADLTAATTAVIALLLPLAAFEALAHVHIVQDLLGKHLPIGAQDIRMGMLRAMATFDHPILFGTFCASALSLTWYCLPRKRWVNVPIILICVALSASSAAYLAVALQAGLIAWEYATAHYRYKWYLLGFLVFAALLLADIFSHRTLAQIFVGSLTLNPQTGFIRLIQWDYGWQNIYQNMIFGLGNRDWVRPLWLGHSVDDFWLLEGMRFGILGFVASTGSILIALLSVIRNAPRVTNARDEPTLKAWALTMVMLLLVGFTVDFWTSMHAFLFLLLGSGMFLANRANAEVSAAQIHVRRPLERRARSGG